MYSSVAWRRMDKATGRPEPWTKGHLVRNRSDRRTMCGVKIPLDINDMGDGLRGQGWCMRCRKQAKLPVV